jgi:hypothetical protein
VQTDAGSRSEPVQPPPYEEDIEVGVLLDVEGKDALQEGVRVRPGRCNGGWPLARREGERHQDEAKGRHVARPPLRCA